MPFRQDIPFHTIAGDYHGNLENPKTDGVVPYSSAHLDGAASELVIDSGHHVERKEAAFVELRRILLLHAQGTNR